MIDGSFSFSPCIDLGSCALCCVSVVCNKYCVVAVYSALIGDTADVYFAAYLGHCIQWISGEEFIFPHQNSNMLRLQGVRSSTTLRYLTRRNLRQVTRPMAHRLSWSAEVPYEAS